MRQRSGHVLIDLTVRGIEDVALVAQEVRGEPCGEILIQYDVSFTLT